MRNRFGDRSLSVSGWASQKDAMPGFEVVGAQNIHTLLFFDEFSKRLKHFVRKDQRMESSLRDSLNHKVASILPRDTVMAIDSVRLWFGAHKRRTFLQFCIKTLGEYFVPFVAFVSNERFGHSTKKLLVTSGASSHKGQK